MIEKLYINVPIPQNKYHYYVLQTFTNRKEAKKKKLGK